MSNPLFVRVLTSLLVLNVGAIAHAQRVVDQGMVIENVTLISPERATPLLRANVVIRDGQIVEVGTKLVAGPQTRRIDGRGQFLIPGLIDSHVHVGHSAALDDDAIGAHPELWASYRAQVPRAYLAFGFTSVVDLDTTPTEKTWFEATPLHPTFYSCGAGIKVAGGYMAFDVPTPSAPNFPNLVYEPKEADHWPKSLKPSDYTPERAVSRAADAGGICVKAFVESGFGVFNWPYLHTGTLKKVQAVAKERKLVLIVHANSVDRWQSALDAYADIIAHGLWVWPGRFRKLRAAPGSKQCDCRRFTPQNACTTDIADSRRERAMIDPALLNDPRLAMALPPGVIAYLRSAQGVKARNALLDEYRKASPPPGFEPLLKATIERTRATFKIMLQEHVPLIFGSDTPGVDGFGNPPGLNGRFELQNWADAGAPLTLILRAATLDNASLWDCRTNWARSRSASEELICSY